MTSTEQQIEQFIGILISLGGSAGNQRLLEALGWQDSIYQRIKQQLIDNGRIRPGRGRGGSVALVENVASLPKPGTKPSAAIKRQANEARKEDKHDATRDKDMRPIEQQFFNDLEKKLWTAADKLRSNLDAAVYKHVVLGLIFLKYVSDAFEERQRELREQFTNPDHDYYMDPDEYGGAGTQEYEDNIATELEVRDYYTEKNVFWVPVEARWQTLRDCAQLPPGEALPWNAPGKDVPEKMRSVGWLIDNAMEAVERENARLKNVLNKDFARVQLDSSKLAGLISHFSDTDFAAREYKGQPLDLKSKDILGHVYEYFLGQFALAEGKKGGQYYTPKSIVTLIVEMLQPFKGRVYDPAMGSGGFFVQSEEFIEQHGGKAANGKSGQISVYGQESNPTTWRLAAMNMAIRGIDFNFGTGPADTLLNDLHPDLRADFVMANPPFNMKEWWNEKLAACRT